MNTVYRSYFKPPRPVRAAIGVAELVVPAAQNQFRDAQSFTEMMT